MRFENFIRKYSKSVLFFCAFAVTVSALSGYYYSKHKAPIILADTTVLSQSAEAATPETAVSNMPDDAVESPAQPADSGEQQAPPAESSGLNINQAGIEQLKTLPGIGEVLAKRILAYRDAHGAFRDVRELKRVEGIGKSKFEDIKDLVCVE